MQEGETTAYTPYDYASRDFEAAIDTIDSKKKTKK